MLIDFHAHVFLDKLAPRAVQSLAERAHIVPHTDGLCATRSASCGRAASIGSSA